MSTSRKVLAALSGVPGVPGVLGASGCLFRLSSGVGCSDHECERRVRTAFAPQRK